VSEKSISIVLRAKNAMAAGLSSAGKALHSFGNGVLKIGKWLSVGFLAGGAALAGFTAKALQAYAEQERAHKSLAASLSAHGEAAKQLLPSLVEMAEAIQDETGADAEATVAGMAKMRMLGVQTSKLGEAAKAVIALKSVGLDEAAAQKAVAMAMQGNYMMLNRYVPALREATSASEKARIVNELFAKGYDQQKALLNTVSGQWGLFKERVGDVWEEIGRGIATNEGLMRVLKRAGDAVKRFGDMIREWVDSEQFKEISTSVEGIIKAIAGGGKGREQAVAVVGEVLMASFARGAEIAVEFLKTAAPVIGKLIGSAARLAWETLTGPAMTDKAEARKQLKNEGQSSNPKWVTLVRDRAKEIMQARLMKELGLDKLETIEGETAAQTRLRIALEKAKKIGEQYADQNKKATDDAITAAQARAAMEAQAAKDRVEAEKKAAAEIEKTKAAAGKKEAARDIKTTQDFIARVNKRKAELEKLATARVQTVIDEAKAAKDEEKSQAKDDKKAARLEDSVKRQARLGKKEKDWLEAYNKIKEAKSEYNTLDRAGQLAEYKLQKEQDAQQAQIESAASLKKIEEKIDAVLEYSE